MRERKIVLDVETTGKHAEEGHRIVSLGCVELLGYNPDGEQREWFFNPRRNIPEETYAIHGISEKFLADKPEFAELAEEILAFLGDDAPLVIHNAKFDMSFLNAELAKCGRPLLAESRAVDTLQMARRMFPGERASLDNLARRFQISLESRVKHGALLDAQILAQVYRKLVEAMERKPAPARTAYRRSGAVVRALTAGERASHEKVLERLKIKNWRYADG